MVASEVTGINLEGLEEVFRICGKPTGMAALDQRIAEYVKATDPRIARFLKEMEKYDKPRLQGSPGSDNNTPKDDKSDPKYFAPTRRLQDMLCEEWFDQASDNKTKYTRSWRINLIDALMTSEYRSEIAKEWANKDLRLQLKGHVIGALMDAGVFRKKKALPIARIYYGTGEENTTEVKTLAKYMGESRKTYYADWIIEYVTKDTIENQIPPIEK